MIKNHGKCENCDHRGIDGGPSPVMVCNISSEDLGYIISWVDGKRTPKEGSCPLDNP